LIPNQVEFDCINPPCTEEYYLNTYLEQITIPAGYQRPDPHPVIIADDFVEGPVTDHWCQDSSGDKFMSGSYSCGPGTTDTTAPENFEVITPFAGTAFDQLVAAGKDGVTLYNDAGVVAGTASMTATPDSEPVFMINITDPTIAGMIHINVDELTSWVLDNNALVMVATEPGAGSITIRINYEYGRLRFLLAITEHWVREGVCCQPSTLKVRLYTELIPVTV